MFRIILLVCLAFVPSVVFADMANQRKLAEELFQLMGTEAQIKTVFDQMEKMQTQVAKDIVKDPDHPEAAAMMDKQGKAIQKDVREAFSWDKMKDDYIQMYAEVYTEEELLGVINFFKSPVGKSYLSKMPELMTRSMKLSQDMIMKMKPKFDQYKAEAMQQGK